MKKSLLTIFIFAIYGCNNYNNNFAILNPSNFIVKEIYLSHFTDDIKYIPLDTKVPFAHILYYEFSDSLIFVGTFPTGLLVYDLLGNFKYRIGNIGNGPGEYKYASNFTINRQDKYIYILDRNNIIIYTIDGKFVNQFSVEEYAGNFQKIEFYDGKIFLFEFISYGHATYDWIVLDKEGNLLSSKYNQIPDFKTNLSGGGDVFRYNNKIYYCNEYNDTIFEIDKEKFRPLLLFGDGDFRKPKYTVNKLGDTFKYVYITKTKKDIIITYYYDGIFYTSIFELNKNKLIAINKSNKLNHNWGGPGIINDIDGGIPFLPKFGHQLNEQNYLSSWEFSYEIKAYISTKKFRNSPNSLKKKREFEQLANSLNENDNPVLMLVKLKE